MKEIVKGEQEMKQTRELTWGLLPVHIRRSEVTALAVETGILDVQASFEYWRSVGRFYLAAS